MDATAPAAAWYPDPHDPAWLRWWNGSAWTEHVHRVPGQGEPVVELAATVPPAAASELWPVPAIDAPLFRERGYTKGAHASFRAAHRRELLRRGWEFPFVLAGAAVTLLLALLLAREHQGEEARRAHADASNMVNGWLNQRRAVARDAVWDRLFRARGLQPIGVPTEPRWESMRRAAEWLRIDHVGGPPRWAASGELCGMPATCGEIAFERRTDDGLARTSLRMFAAFRIPPGAAERHPRVGARRRSLPLLGARLDGVEVRLESTAVAKALVIKVARQAEELATRELLGPQVVAALADTPVCWDQRGDVLVVWNASPSEPGPVFDGFCRAAGAVARAYWADQQ